MILFKCAEKSRDNIPGFFALLVYFTVSAQFLYKMSLPGFSLVSFFSYFTVLSNLFAAVVLTLLALGYKSKNFDSLRDAAVFYMVITGAVYVLLLSRYQGDPGLMLPWANLVLHMIMPVVMILDWIISPPGKKLKYRVSLKWLIFPLVFVFYTLIRGYFINWYPYPFLDPQDVGGYAGVLGYVVVILSFALAFGAVLIFVGNNFVKSKKFKF